MIKQKHAQYILNSYLNIKPGSLSGKLKEKILLLLRKKFINYADPEVKYRFSGGDMWLPFSHNLPINKKIFPVYADNIGRLASLIKRKYEGLGMIDIGANVGDTAVLVKKYEDIPVLCIEGEEKYFSLLQKNTGSLNSVFLEKSFVGDKTRLKGNYIYSQGTGRISEGESSTPIHFKTLEEILNSHASFRNSKLLKIDTDGFDCRIIRNTAGLLKKMKPVIFFEYDPYLLHQLKDDGLSIFNLLLASGYNKAIFYDNTGDFLISESINNSSQVADIHYYFSGRNMERYCDIAVFHEEDNDLADQVRNSEIEFYSKARNYPVTK